MSRRPGRFTRGVGEQPTRSIDELRQATTVEELMPDPDRRDVALGALALVVDNAHRIYGSMAKRRPVYLDVLEILSHGGSPSDAAAKLHITRSAVKLHLKKARRELDATNTEHAVTQALRRGLIR